MSLGPSVSGNAASYFLGLNRITRGMAIDFGQEAGHELLLSLLEDADVFLENFKIGTLEKWGIGQDGALSCCWKQRAICKTMRNAGMPRACKRPVV